MSTLRKPVPWLLVTAVLVIASSACFGGDEPVEYLHRPDSIILQRVTTSGPPEAALPDFTLYGDGTLIYRQRVATLNAPLMQATLPDESVLSLLERFVDAGFLDFRYEQPRPGRATSQPTTYVYVHTLTAANAVAAYAVNSVLPGDAGGEFDDFRELQRLVEGLGALDPAALGGSAPAPYEPEQVLLTVAPKTPPTVSGGVARWPSTTISLNEIAPGPEAGTRVVTSADVAAFSGLGEAIGFWEGERYFQVSWRPLLPFEENFPEFYLP